MKKSRSYISRAELQKLKHNRNISRMEIAEIKTQLKIYQSCQRHSWLLQAKVLSAPPMQPMDPVHSMQWSEDIAQHTQDITQHTIDVLQHT